MKYKSIIWILTFVLLVGLVSAVTVPDGGTTYYNFSSTVDLWGSNDGTNQGGQSLASYPSFNIDGDSSPDSFNFVASQTDYFETNYLSTFSSTGFTVSVWFKTTQSAEGYVMGYTDEQGSFDPFFALVINEGADDDFLKFRLRGNGGSNLDDLTGTTNVTDDVWHNGIVTYNVSSGNLSLYTDGVLEDSKIKTFTGSFDPSIYDYWIGALDARGSPAGYFNGAIDEVKFYNYSFSKNESLQIYNYGALIPPPAPLLNDSTESTAVVKQSGSVSFTVTPTTILSSSFTVPVNNTPLYGGYSFNIESNGNNNVFCDLLIDGVSQANITRSQTTGELGSVFIQFPTIVLDNSTNHTQSLVCNRVSGTGILTVSNAVGIGHFLIDQQGDFLNYNTSTIDFNVSSGNNFTLMDSFTILIGNKTNNSAVNPRRQHIVLEGSFNYINNDASTEVLSMYASINNSNCTFTPRTVNSGSSGSVSYDCILQNVTASQIYNVSIYGNGTNANYVGNIVAKNFFLSNNEIIGGTGILTGFPFSGDTWTKLIEVPGGNNNHDVANAFSKLSFALSSNESTTMNFYFNISNGLTYTTVNFTRDFEPNVIGVLNGHDSILSLPKDDYNVSLWANCGSSSALCTIQGGQTGGYLTDVITTLLNSFNITAYNIWNNQTILNFNVTNSATYTTTNGVVNFFSPNSFENLTISSNNYFNTTVLNHNTSTNLNISLKQSDIKFRATEIITDDYVAPANFTINGITKGVNESFYLVPGTYNVTFSKTGWFNKTLEFIVSALDNKTINITDVSSTALNISAQQYTTTTNILNFSGVLYNSIYDITIPFSTTTGSVTVGVALNQTFLVNISADGFASTSENVTINESPVQNYTSIMFPFNSINIIIKDITTGNIIQPQRVDLAVIEENTSFVNSTTNGTFLVSLLTPQDYELRVNTSGYVTTSSFVTVLNDSTQNLTIYLDKNTTDTQQIRVIDIGSNRVAGAIVTVQKEILNNTNLWVTVSQVKTNSEGQAFIFVEKNPVVFYRFSVSLDGQPLTIGTGGGLLGQTGTGSGLFTSKTSFLSTISEVLQIIVIIDESVEGNLEELEGIDYNVTYSNNDTFITYDFVDARSTIVGGSLIIYGKYLNSTVGYEVISNQSIIGSSGTITYTLPIVNNTVYKVKAFINFQNSDSLVHERIITFDNDLLINPGTSLFLSIIILMAVALLTYALGPLISASIFTASMFVLVRLSLLTIPTTIISTLIAIVVLLFIKKRRSL